MTTSDVDFSSVCKAIATATTWTEMTEITDEGCKQHLHAQPALETACDDATVWIDEPNFELCYPRYFLGNLCLASSGVYMFDNEKPERR